MIVEQLASDPGAWNIIVWAIVIGVVGAGLLWGLTTVLLQTSDETDAPTDEARS